MNDQQKAQHDELMAFIAAERAAAKAKDKTIRNNEHYRMATYKILQIFAEYIQTVAYDAAVANGEDKPVDPFIMDEYADAIVWMVAEYFNGGIIDRDDEIYTMTPRAHQFTDYHIGYWFGVTKGVPREITSRATIEPDVISDSGHILHQDK